MLSDTSLKLPNVNDDFSSFPSPLMLLAGFHKKLNCFSAFSIFEGRRAKRRKIKEELTG